MSTPRTDAVVNYDTEKTLVAQLCSQLETELATARADAFAEAARIAPTINPKVRGYHQGMAKLCWDTAIADYKAAIERAAKDKP